MVANLTWSQIGTIFGILAMIAGALAVLRVSYFKSALEALRNDRDDLMKRIEILEGERDQHAVDKEKLEALLESEKQKAEVLAGVVNGRDILIQIRQTLSEQIKVTNDRQVEMYEKIEKIFTKIGADVL